MLAKIACMKVLENGSRGAGTHLLYNCLIIEAITQKSEDSDGMPYSTILLVFEENFLNTKL